MLQTYFLNEINRGKAGLGNYTLKSCYGNLAIPIEQLRQVNTVTPAKIIENLRSKTFMVEGTSVPQYSKVKYTIASQIIANDAITFSPKLGIFIVMNPDIKSVESVT